MRDREIELDDDIDFYEYTPDGFNLETGKYDPLRDAFYPDIKSFGVLKEYEDKMREKYFKREGL